MCPRKGNGVVITRADSSNAAMALQTGQALADGFFEERFLRNINVTALGALSVSRSSPICPPQTDLGDSEADVHSRSHRLVGDDLVYIWVSLESRVDKTGLLLRDCLLSVDFLLWEGKSTASSPTSPGFSSQPLVFSISKQSFLPATSSYAGCKRDIF